MAAPSLTTTEIATQPDCWQRAAELAPEQSGKLPARGERVAVIGCGTSWFMAQAFAALRENTGQGETDAFAASEFPLGRRYDRVLAITRSGTTTEVLRTCEQLLGTTPVTALTADPKTPVMQAADEVVVLDFADEQSVVQTRFATTALALLRAHLGEDLTTAISDARAAVTADLAPEALAAEQITFLGTGWTYGLAQEAALKMREAAGAWTEAYPAMEYRHGPISITGPGRVAWSFGPLPEGLDASIAAVGGHLEHRPTVDPLADLVRAQRVAVAIAEAKGYDPDRPRNLTRSVILP
ncbi:Fructoselysine-6-P-deglycase FrlB with duplicated sugar isomerase (SIS) domain [Actinacidiphila yanglinensis]|uniref:Fructoselysine-6-P-deglycase FrlB with duplicated sugar isomerase (SIS) domain n=1 Tax=Actinacidiphila yanglinensis TaxID=310779 RepID=A0A1H6D4V6_9ACTN|nr:SIS domain-containing protein [Actinacidiphila yanglinensis]SEG79805.1 Fructoselysine-6-P-deglycase FrlB with duplicated sugar isomerase (SIS) domain [Actinacidiphila yanglinensis]